LKESDELDMAADGISNSEGENKDEEGESLGVVDGDEEVSETEHPESNPQSRAGCIVRITSGNIVL
jgi:hypothetical protein